YGRGRVRLLRKHPDTLSPGTLVPAAFVLFVLLGAVAALTHPWVALAYGVTMGLYAALVLAVSTALAWRKRELALLPVLALVFLTVHVGAGVGLLWEALLGAWSSRKQAQQQPRVPAVRRAPPAGRQAPPAPPRRLNALTIDVEDYFHVSAFEGIVSREQWDGFESRVAANTQRLLEVLAEANVRGTFFVLG